MWLANALPRLNFPEAVFLNRFEADFTVFIFGITISFQQVCQQSIIT